MESKPDVLLTREQLVKEKNKVKEKFLPRNGYVIRFPNGVEYKVISSNAGQLRFTALFHRAVSMNDKPLPEEQGPEEKGE